MPVSDVDLLRVLKDKKEYQDIKEALNLKKKDEDALQERLQSLEKQGKIRKEVSGEMSYYEAMDSQETRHISKRSEIIIAAVIILIFTLIYGYLYWGLKQIPGPLYGGDYYAHYAIINHIYDGNFPWTCPQYQDNWAFYPWLLHLLVVVIAKITGNLLESYLLYFPVLVVIAGGVLSYLLGRELFKNKLFALLLCFGWMGTRLFVDYIPANFTPTVMTPLLLLATLKALKSGKAKWVVAAGVSFGLFIMSHVATLPPGVLLLVLLWLYYSFAGNVRFDVNPEDMRVVFKANRERLRESVTWASKILIPIGVIGFVIGLLYWGPVFFLYHFQVKNSWADYTMPDYTIYGLTIAKETILSYLFNIDALSQFATAMMGWHIMDALNSLLSFLVPLLTLIGLVGVIRDRKDLSSSFLAIAFFTGFFGYFHYFVTEPILHTNYSPLRIENFMLNPAAFILSIYGVYVLYSLFRTDRERKIFFVIAFIFFAVLAAEKVQGDYNSQWTKLGLSPEFPQTSEMASWVDENTDKNAVFLSTEELSFALNGLTGRKLVIDRRTHSNPYVDIDERISDAAVMLYGNNEEKTLQLLKVYNVSYLYWDANWMTIAANEPSMAQPKYKDYLDEYGVKYQQVTTYLDPAWSERYKRYNMLAVMPASNNPMQPWSDVLQKHLKLVKAVDIDGEAAYRIYEIV